MILTRSLLLWMLGGLLLLAWGQVQAMPLGVSRTDYVADELLISLVDRTSASMFQVQSAGLAITSIHKGYTPFLRVKLKRGQSMSAAMASLAAMPGVRYVQPNYIYRASALPNDPRFPDYWSLQNTGQSVNGNPGIAGADIAATKAWDEQTDCSGIVVAVIDTGVDYNHPDLETTIWKNAGEIPGNGIDDDNNSFVDDDRGWDFVQGDNDPMDFNKHGTHVAGTIGAIGNNNIGGTGICWKAKIMPLRVLGSTGVGTTAEIIAAIDYAVANGAKILNLSLTSGGGSPGDLLDQAIQHAHANGVLAVIAAGNSNANNDAIPTYPASYPQQNIIAVAATDQTDALASFSNFGATSVDVGAPGTNILSSVPPPRTPVCSWNFDDGTAQSWTLSTWDNSINAPLTNTVAVTNEDANSPLYSLTDTPGGLYANNRSYRAQSPACDLTGQQGSILSYSLNLASESNADWLIFEHSSDAATWNEYLRLSGVSNGWLISSDFGFDVDLQALDGMATAFVRARLETNATNTFDGFHLDDIAITVPNTGIPAHSVNDYAFLDGTSMATPHVAGAAALVWAAEIAAGNSNVTHLQIRDQLLNNGDQLAALVGKTVTGKRINLQMSMPLHAPTQISANVISSSRVDLSWQDNAVSESAYLVKRDVGHGFVTVASLNADAISFTDASAPPDTNLVYKIVAEARDGRQVSSQSVNVTTPPAPPAPPSSGGGGGCTLGHPDQQQFDPLLLFLIGLSVVVLWHRRNKS